MRRVIVTRPLPQGPHQLPQGKPQSAQGPAQGAVTDWLSALQAHGLRADALPLLTVAPLQPAQHAALIQALGQAWQALAHYQAVVFVSAPAVTHFFAARPAPALPRFAPQAWVTGPGSRAALLQAGVAASQIRAPALEAAQFDSEALWQQVGASVQAGQQFLIVRGADGAGQVAGRNWLAQQLAAAGGQVTQVAAYQRLAPQWSADQRALAQTAASDGSIWLLSSSEATAHLAQLLPQQSWQQALALATHERIARAARNLGFVQVRQAKPLLDDVLAQISAFEGNAS